MIPRVQKDIPAALVQESGEPRPARISVAIRLRDPAEGEPPEQVEAEFQVELSVADGPSVTLPTLLTRKKARVAAEGLAALAAGGDEPALISDQGVGLDLWFDPVPGNAAGLTVHGEYIYMPADPEEMKQQWPAGAVFRPRAFSEWTVLPIEGLLVTRRDAGALAAFFQGFLDEAGEALAEPSPYDP